MKILKSLALSLLGFFLFLCLYLFGTLYALDKTFLNPDFITSELDRLDVSSLAGELFSIEAPPEAPYLDEAIEKTIVDLEPWLKEEINTAIYSSYDYLMGKTQRLMVTIPTQLFRDSLRDNLWEAFSESPPPELEGLPPAIKERYFNEAYDQLVGDAIPPTIEFTESSLPPEVLTTLEQVRQAMSYYQLAYNALIGFMALMVIGIILISRQVIDITRRLGTPCLTYGAIGYASIFATKYFIGKGVTLPDLPPSLQTWMSQFIINSLVPMEIFSLALLITGIVLVVVSFVYKPRQSSSES
ncbi:hypothetical protein ACFLXU_00090 [Chloroflexota bacterium]